jgi:hypothetical protein
LSRKEAQVKSQGPNQTAYPLITVAERANAGQKELLSLAMLACAGTRQSGGFSQKPNACHIAFKRFAWNGGSCFVFHKNTFANSP